MKGRSAGLALTAAVLGASLVLVLLVWALPVELALAIVREGGLIEAPTALAFAGAAALAIGLAVRDRWWSGGAVGVLLAAAAARELDFHRRFTTQSIEKGTYVGFLASPAVPWLEKLAVGVVLAVLAGAAVALIAREWRPFLVALRARHSGAVAVVGGVVALVAAQGFDKLTGRAGQIVPGLPLLAKAAEEHLELAGAVLFLLALLLRSRRA